MFFSLNPERLKRYKNIAMLIIHHNNEPIFRKSEFDESEISESDLEDVEIRRDAVRLRIQGCCCRRPKSHDFSYECEPGNTGYRIPALREA